jgi:hypothetical protein
MVIAQDADTGKISFAVLGGVNFQNITGKDWDASRLANDLIIGYHAGVSAQIIFMPQFCFQPGLLFSAKGTKWPDSKVDRLYYVELPLNIVYKGLLGKGHIMIGIGPYIACAVFGKATDENDVKSDIIFTKFIKVGDDLNLSYYRLFDGGGNLFVGYELANGIFCQLNTQLSGFNINPEDRNATHDENAWRNAGFGLSLGYRFK